MCDDGDVGGVARAEGGFLSTRESRAMKVGHRQTTLDSTPNSTGEESQILTTRDAQAAGISPQMRSTWLCPAQWAEGRGEVLRKAKRPTFHDLMQDQEDLKGVTKWIISKG